MRHHGLALTACLLAAATEAMQVGPRKATAPLAEPSCLQDVAAFHSLFGAPVVDEPALPDAERCALRVNLLQEELDEFRAALEAEDIVEAADALVTRATTAKLDVEKLARDTVPGSRGDPLISDGVLHM